MSPRSDSDPALNPLPWYRTMREHSPVVYAPQRGFWSAFRYDDVQRVLSDYATFSSERWYGDAPPQQPLAASLISTDPPRHRQLRTLVNQAFTPRAVARLEPRIRQLTTELLDAVTPSGSMDIIDDLAYPLPVIVIAELLGIPPEDRARFKLWSDIVVHGAHASERGGEMRNADPQGEMREYFLRMIEQRRREPADDLISALLAAEIDGQRLTELELLGFCVLLLIAGNETTTNLIGNAMLCFDQFPDEWRRLREQPELLPSAIEEVLRYRSPVQSMMRVTKTATRLGDAELPAGAPVLAWIGAANHDEAVFERPDEFDITRAPNRHLAFGYGIHFCLGAPLARLEGRIALGELLARIPDVRLAPDAQLEPLGGMIVFGVRGIPVRFTPERHVAAQS